MFGCFCSCYLVSALELLSWKKTQRHIILQNLNLSTQMTKTQQIIIFRFELRQPVVHYFIVFVLFCMLVQFVLQIWTHWLYALDDKRENVSANRKLKILNILFKSKTSQHYKSIQINEDKKASVTNIFMDKKVTTCYCDQSFDKSNIVSSNKTSTVEFSLFTCWTWTNSWKIYNIGYQMQVNV